MSATMENTTYVVTGGASGIGKALVVRLRGGGARVIAVDRSTAVDADETVLCDLADERSIADALAALPEQLNGVVSVAGASGAHGAETAFGVNFLGLRAVTAGLLPRVTTGGAVVNVASTAGANWRRHLDLLREGLTITSWNESLAWFQGLGLNGTTAYDLSKELAIFYSQTVSLDRVADGVRVNTVSPGPVSTPLLREFGVTMGEDSLDRIRATVGRDGRPEEIAAVICFLLSPEASWINGADIQVDGGAEAGFNTGQIGSARTGAPAA